MSAARETKTAALTVHAPVLPEGLPVRPFEDAVTEALASRSDIDGVRFDGDEASGVEGTALEFSACLFERCTLDDWSVKRLSFVDCVFDHCDLSGLGLKPLRSSACVSPPAG
jgi:hypothetical protein